MRQCHAFDRLMRLAFVLPIVGLTNACAAGQVRYGVEPPPPAGIHPRVFLTPSELPALRARVLSGLAKYSYQRAQQDVVNLSLPPQQAIIVSLESGKGASESNLETVGTLLREAALAALIGRDPTAIAASKRALLAFVHGVSPTKPAMDYAKTAVCAAIAYDDLFGDLSAQEQEATRTWISQACVAWNSVLQTQNHGFQPPKSQHNFNWVDFNCGAFGISALSIEGESGYQPNWYTDAAASLTDFLDYGIEPEGEPLETIHYFAYGMINGAYFLDAMGRRGAPVWSHPHLLKVPRWWAYDMFPWGKQFNSIGDCRDLMMGEGEIYYRLALAHPDDPVAQWVCENHLTARNSTASPTSIMLWAPEPKGNRTAGELGLPLTGVFSTNGMVYMRSGWGVDDTYLEFQSDPVGWGPSHAHPDRNAFTLMSKGRIWALDPGFHLCLDVDHNEVLIDGKGEGLLPEPGKLVDSADVGWAAAAMGDASDAYNWQGIVPWTKFNGSQMVNGLAALPYNPVQTAFRSATMVRGEHSYVVIADDLKKDGQIHRFSWQMLTPLGNEIDPLTPTSAMMRPVDNGKCLQELPQAPGAHPDPIHIEFDVSKDETYHPWVLMGHDYVDSWTSGLYFQLDGGPQTRYFAREEDNAEVHWQDITINGKPTGVFLKAGHHKLDIQSIGPMRFAAILVAPGGYDPTSATAIQPPSGMFFARFSDLGTPKGWEQIVPDSHQPELLVQLLNPSTVAITGEVFRPIFGNSTNPDVLLDPAKTPDRSKLPTDYPILRLSLDAQTIDPQYHVMLYPHRAGDPIPTVRSTANSAVITWPDGIIDTWTFGRTLDFAGTNGAAIRVQRKGAATLKSFELLGK